jgi:hypothetical protein
MDSVRAALSVGTSGQIPRRAVVLADGALADRREHPDRPEVCQVSVACECLRVACSEAVYSRNTAELMAQCFSGNDPRAWEALLDDIATNDLSAESATRYLHTNRVTIVECLLSAATSGHVVLIVRAAQHVLPLLAADELERTSAALCRRFDELVKKLVQVVQRGRIPVDFDDGITALGKLMLACDVPPCQLAAMLEACLASGVDSLMRLFLFAPVPVVVAHAPALVDSMVARAEKAPQSSRYPILALLAMVPSHVLSAHADRLASLVQRVLDTALAQGGMDPKLALACGTISKHASTTPKSLHATLSHTLCCMAYAVLTS